jgi:membrane protein YdbS with pleckstrin-like domain
VNGRQRGVRVAWLLLTAVAIGDLIIAAVRWPARGALVINVTLLVLLLWPNPLRFVHRPRARRREIASI